MVDSKVSEKTKSKCVNNQIEIDFYYKLGLDLGECVFVEKKMVKPETCSLRNLCGRYLCADFGKRQKKPECKSCRLATQCKEVIEHG